MLTDPELKILEEKLDELMKLHQATSEDNARLRDLLANEQSVNRQLVARINLAAERLQKLLDNFPES